MWELWWGEDISSIGRESWGETVHDKCNIRWGLVGLHGELHQQLPMVKTQCCELKHHGRIVSIFNLQYIHTAMIFKSIGKVATSIHGIFHYQLGQQATTRGRPIDALQNGVVGGGFPHTMRPHGLHICSVTTGALIWCGSWAWFTGGGAGVAIYVR